MQMDNYNKDTSCKNCIFAQYEGITQIDCELGLIEKYKENNIEIHECYDNEKEFYNITRQCMYRRTAKWGEKYPLNKLAQIKDEVRIVYQVIVIANNYIEDLEDTLATIYWQTLKPKHITIVRPYGNVLKAEQILPLIKDKGIKWRIESVVSKDVRPEKYQDLVLSVCNYPYYCLLQAGDRLEDDMFELINRAITEDFLIFAALTQNGKLFFMQYLLHDLFHGSSYGLLLDKLKENYKEIYEVSEITSVQRRKYRARLSELGNSSRENGQSSIIL